VISCPSASLCVGTPYPILYQESPPGAVLVTSTDPTAGSATRHQTDFPLVDLGPIECPSVSSCIMVGFGAPGGIRNAILSSTKPTGRVAAWQVVGPAGPGSGVLSCPTVSFCAAAAVDAPNFYAPSPPGVYVSTHPSGSSPGAWKLSLSALIRALSCAGPTLCVTGDSHGFLRIGTRPT
jgi:hypothetical protein